MERWLEKILAVTVLVLTLLMAACGREKEKTDAGLRVENASDHYAAKKVFEEDLFAPEAHYEWIQGNVFYQIGKQSLRSTNIVTRETSYVALDLGERRTLPQMAGSVDAEGRLHVFCSDRMDLGSKDRRILYCILDAEGKLLLEEDVTDAMKPAVVRLPIQILLQDGRLAVFYQNENDRKAYYLMLSEQGKVTSCKELGRFRPAGGRLDKEGSIVLLEHNNVIAEQSSYGISKVNLKTGERQVLAENLPGEGFLSFTVGKIENPIWYRDNEAVWECDLEGGIAKRLFSFEDLSLNPLKTGYVIRTEDSIYVLVLTGEPSVENVPLNFYSIVKGEGNGAKERKDGGNVKTELVFATVLPKELYVDDVYEYNASQDKVKIILKSYEDENLFLADLMAGNVPDIVDISMPLVHSALEKQNLLEDLSAYFSADNDVSKEDFLEKAFDFYGKGERVYAVPEGMFISAFMGDRLFLEGVTGWNFEEFCQFIDSLPYPTMVTQGTTNEDMLYFLCQHYLEQFVDQTAETCNFLTENFTKLLRCAEKFAAPGTGYSEDDEKYYKSIENGEIMLIPTVFGGVESFAYARAVFPNGGKVLGIPSEDRKGIYLSSSGFAYAMTKTSGHKDLVWDFIKYQITHKKLRVESSAIPLYRPFYDKMMEDARKQAALMENSERQTDLKNFNAGVPPLTNMEIDALETLMEEGKTVSDSDESILEIILEEAMPYFVGRKTAEEVENVIQGRVALFLSE